MMIRPALFALVSFGMISLGFAAEEAVVKLQSDTPVIYHLKMEMDVKQKTKTAANHTGKLTLESTFIVNVNSKTTPYELLLTPKYFYFDLNAGGLTVTYDTKKALEDNFVLEERGALQTIINHTFLMPLTTDYSLNQAEDFYLLRAPQDSEFKPYFEKAIAQMVQAIKEGIRFTVGQKTEEEIATADVKVHQSAIVTRIDDSQVTLNGMLTFDTTSYHNEHDRSEGGIQIIGKGNFEKTLQRANLLQTTGTGKIAFEVIEIPGSVGKQILNNGNLMVTLDLKLVSTLPDIEMQLITNKTNENPKH